jgi:2-polyprenyl-3-methyl-5-hydroxy-6-metoxy-1,4-benzoquinol methylase
MMTNTYWTGFFEEINRGNPIHAKYLSSVSDALSENEKKEFCDMLRFYEHQGIGVSDQAAAYFMLVSSTLEERKYFVEHGSYRYSTYKEIADSVYQNPDYMRKYMVGLCLSQYLWQMHIKGMRWFAEKIEGLSGRQSLEIGPGHGIYFSRFVERTDFQRYRAVDISPTSVKMTQDYLQYRSGLRGGAAKNVSVEHCDFFEYNQDEKFDAIVMAEVLEHVENPLDFLRKIRELAGGLTYPPFIYISTCINAPEIDHIFRFRTVDEVTNLFGSVGLSVTDWMYATAKENALLELEMKKRAPIFVAFTLTC